jgi:hypothetical protein
MSGRPRIARRNTTLVYTMVLPGQKSSFQAGSRPDSADLKIGPPAVRRPAGVPILKLSRLESGRNPARKPDFGPKALLHNIGYSFVEHMIFHTADPATLLHGQADSAASRRTNTLLC